MPPGESGWLEEWEHGWKHSKVAAELSLTAYAITLRKKQKSKRVMPIYLQLRNFNKLADYLSAVGSRIAASTANDSANVLQRIHVTQRGKFDVRIAGSHGTADASMAVRSPATAGVIHHKSATRKSTSGFKGFPLSHGLRIHCFKRKKFHFPPDKKFHTLTSGQLFTGTHLACV